MDVAVIKYNAGNIGSVLNALDRIGVKGEVTSDPQRIQKAPRVIFPGVGEAGSTMQHLRNSGLDRIIRELTSPVLGICLGMQLLCREMEEGRTLGLEVFDAPVTRFRGDVKIPHMGWNSIEFEAEGLFNGINSGSYVYFVHSYYVPVTVGMIASCQYGLKFTAAVRLNNFYATQFHPEKSGLVGEQILKNFMDL